MANSFVNCRDTCADVVQDVYLKLLEKQEREGSLESIRYKDDVNEVYMYIAIRNTAFNLKKQYYIEHPFEDASPEYDASQDQDEQARLDAMKEAIEGLHWYNKKMLHLNTDMSVRKISEATNIHYMSIYNTIKKTKEYVRKKIAAKTKKG